MLPLSATQVITVGAFGTIKATEDGGKTWADVDAPAITSEKYHLNAIARLRDGRIAVVGERGLVGLSADGRKWQRIALPYEGSLFGVLPLGERGLAVFGMRGNVYVSDAPETGQWTKVETSTTSSLFGGAVQGADALVLAGADGALLTLRQGVTTATPLALDAALGDATIAAVLPAAQGPWIVASDKGLTSAGLKTK